MIIKPNLLAEAVINNPVLTGVYGGGSTSSYDAGGAVALLIATFMKTMFNIAGLGFILYFALGAVKWLTAGGDKGKVEEAKQQIMNAVTGLIAMASLYAIVAFLNGVLHIDLLKISWPTPSGSTS